MREEAAPEATKADKDDGGEDDKGNNKPIQSPSDLLARLWERRRAHH